MNIGAKWGNWRQIMLIKNFVRGIVLGLILLTLTLPAVNIRLHNRPKNTTLASGNASMANTITAEVNLEEDRRVETLRNYLKSKNSPLAENAQTFVDVADEYGIDYRLLPAIAGIESNFGQVQLENSYNPFGWGGGYIYFESFEEAISAVGFELYERCVKQRADTPAEIGPSYCPPNYIKWITAVEGFMAEISNARA